MQLLKILLICLFGIASLQARTTDKDSTRAQAAGDSTSRRYLVCVSKHQYKSTVILKQGYKIQVWDSSGRHIRGKLNILENETFEIIGKDASRDTFSLESVKRIKYQSLARTIVSGTLLTIGWIGLISGAALMSTPISNDPYGYNAIGGMVLFVIALPTEISGSRLSKGRRFKSRHYKFRIIKTKGFELKKRHLRYLLPK